MLGFFVDSQTFIMTFYDSNFCLRYNLLTYPISYKKNYPHPYSNGSMKRKKYAKMFPFCPRNPWSIQPTTCLLQHSYPDKPVVDGPPPYITAAEQQACPRTLRDRRTIYSYTGQYNHTLSKKQLYQLTHSLYPEDVTPKISLWLQLKYSNL